jgi:hypothetical protein
MLINRFFDFIENIDWAYGSPCEGVGNWCPTTVPQAGGVRGPKMRHLVLYKLAGFFPTDWQPIGRELCPQKRCQKCAFSCTNWSKLHAFRLGKCKKGGFLQGGGATFWQAKNGGFWGSGRVARDTSRGAHFHSMQASSSFVTLMIAANKKNWTDFFICI